ncbi:MAG: DUF4339 domain-containing protein [Luteolibacter sp.]
MSEWYYSKDGAQLGPVSEAEIKALLANGTIDANTTLVWKTGMADWIPAAQTPELASTAAPAAASDPYAAPASGFASEPAEGAIPLPEIAPGSESIDAVACFKRGLDLTVRHLGTCLLTMVVFFAVTIGVEIVLGMMDVALGWGQGEEIPLGGGESITLPGTSSVLNYVLSHIASVFLSLGLARFCLNIVSGREAGIADLFGQGRLLVRGVLATLLFGIAVGVGFLLLIVPGIYIIARYGLFLTAIVDRNCGISASFEYSSQLTTNNRMNLFLIMLISIAAAVLGCLAFCVGLLFAYPVIMLAWTVAYRWLQYGNRAAMDHPGTATPMLTPTR